MVVVEVEVVMVVVRGVAIGTRVWGTGMRVKWMMAMRWSNIEKTKCGRTGALKALMRRAGTTPGTPVGYHR